MKIRQPMYYPADDAGAAAAPGGGGGGASPPAGAGGTPTPPPAGGDVAAFMAGVDGDTRALITSKGWEKDAKGVGDIFSRAAKNYAEIEKTLGADKVALPPADKDGKRDWSKWDGWKALGRPDAPDGYKFVPPEGKQFSEREKSFQGHMAKAAHVVGLSVAQMDGMSRALGEWAAQVEATNDAATVAENERAEQALRAEWGAAYDTKKELAFRAIGAAGGQELVDALNASPFKNNPAMLKAFTFYGEQFAGDPTQANIPGNARGGGAAMTPAEAKVEIRKIEDDPAQAAILSNKSHVEREALQARLDRLYAMAYPETGAAA